MTAPSISVLMPVIATEPWQVAMTDCASKTMRCTTDVEFELVIVETLSDRLEPPRIGWPRDYHYLHRPERTAQVLDLNAGLDMCGGEFIVYTGNDVWLRPGWLEALLECFDILGCGIACLGMSELGHKPQPLITEGFSGPLMMFKREWRFDEAFPEVFIDADLCMRVYKKGYRSYRNLRVVAVHLLQQTSATLDDEATRKRWFDEGKATFNAKHGGSPLMMYQILSGGRVV